jgi:CheY-like chemotaxis protein
MYFPRTDARPEPPMPKIQDATVPSLRGTETILIVDDDPDVRGYAVSAVRHLGYNALEASDADSALTILASRSDIQLLFTDVGLPGMNGYELAKAAISGQPDLSVVFTSAYARTAMVNLELLNRARLQLLPKPFRIESLARILRSTLDRPLQKQ